jgi:lactate dehydrogenase-like 2-hydroxyacid dehydrogenase
MVIDMGVRFDGRIGKALAQRLVGAPMENLGKSKTVMAGL